jgi:hypothetical protein
MQTISGALSAKGANGYYREDYQSDESVSDSLTKILRDKDNADKNLPLDEEDGGDGKRFGEWSGTLAEELGLSGTVKQKEFHKLSAGRHPVTGEQLIRKVKPRRKEDRFGQVKMTSEHRAGWDLTFSAPKSVSLAALVGGDARIIEAHRKAVDKALKETAEFVEARMGNTRRRRRECSARKRRRAGSGKSRRVRRCCRCESSRL